MDTSPIKTPFTFGTKAETLERLLGHLTTGHLCDQIIVDQAAWGKSKPVQLDPAVTTAGNVVVEQFACVHMGARVINNKRIGEGAIVVAGAVVIRDVQAGEMVGRVPAHPLTKKSNPTPT